MSQQQTVNSNEVIVISLQLQLGFRSVEEVFKHTFLNGCGPATLTREEQIVVARDIERFCEGRVLPAYVMRAFEALQPIV